MRIENEVCILFVPYKDQKRAYILISLIVYI
jgi:hypothetical protein